MIYIISIERDNNITKDDKMVEIYNASRIIVTLEDMWTEEQHEQELNLNTYPAETQERADAYVVEEIERWIKDWGNAKSDTDLDLVSWRRYEA